MFTVKVHHVASGLQHILNCCPGQGKGRVSPCLLVVGCYHIYCHLSTVIAECYKWRSRPQNTTQLLSYLKWAHQLSPHFRNFFSNISKLFVLYNLSRLLTSHFGTRKNYLLSLYLFLIFVLLNLFMQPYLRYEDDE